MFDKITNDKIASRITNKLTIRGPIEEDTDLAKSTLCCYIACMRFDKKSAKKALTRDLAARFFSWPSVAAAARSDTRILAQAMNFGSFEDVRSLEREFGAKQLTKVMLCAEPGWLDDRSWEFWRGRLALATGLAIPEDPPRRSLNGAPL